MAAASWQGRTIADAPETEVVTVEGNIYFPLKAVSCDCLHASSHTSVCPWKGTAHYYDMVVAGNINKNAAWYYPEPQEAAQQIAGRVAFWKGVEVTP